jgi:hypothetical protein
VTVDDGRFLTVEPVGQDHRAADPELEEVLFLPVNCPVEAEVGYLVPYGLTKLIGLRPDACLLAKLAGGRLGERLAWLSASADGEPVRLLGLGGIEPVQQEHPAASVDDKNPASATIDRVRTSHISHDTGEIRRSAGV